MTQADIKSTLDLRRRYRLYLEDLTRVSFTERYGQEITLIVMTSLCLAAVAFAPGYRALGLLGIFTIGRSIILIARKAKTNEGRRKLIESGMPVWCVLVQANSLLFRPGNEDLPCLVLFSFEPAGGHIDYLQRLAGRVFALTETKQTDPDLHRVARYVTDERAYIYRRRLLPVSFTGGPKVYCADLIIVRSCLQSGFLTEKVLPGIAGPGEQGALELLPWWIAAGEGSRPFGL